jgi:hypothetical protein
MMSLAIQEEFVSNGGRLPQPALHHDARPQISNRGLAGFFGEDSNPDEHAIAGHGCGEGFAHPREVFRDANQSCICNWSGEDECSCIRD